MSPNASPQLWSATAFQTVKTIRPVGISWPASVISSRRPSVEFKVSSRRLPVVSSSQRWWDAPYQSDNDIYGPFPWESSKIGPKDGSTVEWATDEIVTFVTTNGIVQLGGTRIPRYSNNKDQIQQRKFKEEDFMDAHQQLCLGAIFNIAATNGLDMGRRICVYGFCRSVEMLSVVVEDTVKEHGGEVVVLEKHNSGMMEKLNLTVAIPLLWGVPPAMDSLNHAIRSGGGIVDKVYNRWEFF